MGSLSGIISTDAARAERSDKGLKGGTLGLLSSTVVGVASTAPAYSLASSLGFVVVLIGVSAPVVTILAFVPMLLISLGYKELNRADPDCGTTFTWATRAFAPKAGWMGGWGIVAADILVMPSLAQIAGQYVFLLFDAKGIGSQASNGWVLLVGVVWIVAMTVICYVGIEISANFQKSLLGIELVMLLVLSIVALVKVGNGSAPAGHLVPGWSWFNPFRGSFPSFVDGLTLMLFIYWGWDTSVSVNEETANKHVFPGRAAVISTLVLLVIYEFVVVATQSYAGLGTKGIGLGNPAHEGDVLSVLGGSIFGSSGFGSFLTHLLLLMVLSSAAASTQNDDPAHRPNHAIDGRVQGPPLDIRQYPPQVPDPDGVHRSHGGRLDRPLCDHELHLRRDRHFGLGYGPRRADRLLLRAHRAYLLLVLQADPERVGAAPVRPGPAPAARMGHHVVHRWLQPGPGLVPVEQFHVVAGTWCALANRGRLPPGGRVIIGGSGAYVRVPGRFSSLLPRGNPQRRHGDLGARRHRCSRRTVRRRRRSGAPRHGSAGVPLVAVDRPQRVAGGPGSSRAPELAGAAAPELAGLVTSVAGPVTAAGPGEAAAGPGEAAAGPGEAAAGPGEAAAGPGEAAAGPGEAAAGPGLAREGRGLATAEVAGLATLVALAGRVVPLAAAARPPGAMVTPASPVGAGRPARA